MFSDKCNFSLFTVLIPYNDVVWVKNSKLVPQRKTVKFDIQSQIDVRLLHHLVSSMPDRIKRCLDLKGDFI